MGVSYRGHYGELIILLAWFKSKHTHQTTSNRNYKMTPAKLQYYQDRFQHEINRKNFLKALCPNKLTEPQKVIIQLFVKERIQSS